MTQRAKAPAGAPTWIDLMTSDPEKVLPFYGELFGWTSTEPDPDYGGYINFLKDGVVVAGCMQNQPEFGTPDVWSVYLASADAKATGDAAEAHGGAVVVPAMDVMELGRMAVVTDPGGASIGVWTALNARYRKNGSALCRSTYATASRPNTSVRYSASRTGSRPRRIGLRFECGLSTKYVCAPPRKP